MPTANTAARENVRATIQASISPRRGRLRSLSMLFVLATTAAVGCASQVGGEESDKLLGADTDPAPTEPDVQVTRTASSIEFANRFGDESILLDNGELTICAQGECTSGGLRAASDEEAANAANAAGEAEEGTVDVAVAMDIDLDGLSPEAMWALTDFIGSVSFASAEELASTQVASLDEEDASTRSWWYESISQGIASARSYLSECGAIIAEHSARRALHGALFSLALGVVVGAYAWAMAQTTIFHAGNTIASGPLAATGLTLDAIAVDETPRLLRILIMGTAAFGAALLAHALLGASGLAAAAVAFYVGTAGLIGTAEGIRACAAGAPTD